MKKIKLDDYNFPAPRRWKAKRIWLSGDRLKTKSFQDSFYVHKSASGNEAQPQSGVYLFRNTLELDELPKKTIIYFATDKYCQIYINGKLAGRGMPPSESFYHFYQEIDASKYLKKGQNCVSVIVDFRSGDKALLLEAVNEKGETILSSSPDWKALKSPAWKSETFTGGPVKQEFFNAELFDAKWLKYDFDDSSWKNCETVEHSGDSNYWAKLVPSNIPQMSEEFFYPEAIAYTEETLDILHRGEQANNLAICLSASGAPVEHSVIKNESALLKEEGFAEVCSSTNHLSEEFFDGIYDPCIILDFGKVISGYLELELEGKSGNALDIGYVERLTNGKFCNSIETPYADRYIFKDGRQSFRSMHWKSFRYVKLRFHKCVENIKIHNVSGILSVYPFEEKGKFACSENIYNKVFDMCRYTVSLCSKGHFMDTPWREQSQWTGDIAAVTIPAVYTCFGDTLMADKFYHQSSMHQSVNKLIASCTHNAAYVNSFRAIPTFALMWIEGVWNHYMYTGEEKWIKELYPQLLQILGHHYHYLNEDGMLQDIVGWVFIDHSFLNTNQGELAVCNALFYGALKIVEKVSQLNSDKYNEQRISELTQTIKANFNEHFYDKEKHCYRDIRLAGKLQEQLSEHSNVLPILYDICDSETAQDIIDRLYVNKTVSFNEADPFFCSYVIKALAKAGRMDAALDVIKQRWGKRMAEKGMSSTPEEWGMSGSWRGNYKSARGYMGIYRSLSHAWSASPAEFLIKNLAGVEIIEPGAGKVKLAPAKTEFNYEVTYPTVKGDINVKCENGKISISKPDGIELI
jgi:hypothetical protein